MDYLTEIEKWRHDAKASVLLPVERHRKHRYPDHTVLNHPSVVWRQFKTSADGKQAFKDRGIVPDVAHGRGPLRCSRPTSPRYPAKRHDSGAAGGSAELL
jgi:hypothetical protein